MPERKQKKRVIHITHDCSWKETHSASIFPCAFSYDNVLHFSWFLTNSRFIITSLVSVYESIVFCFVFVKTIWFVKKFKKKSEYLGNHVVRIFYKKMPLRCQQNGLIYLIDKFSRVFLFSSFDTYISNSSVEAFYFQDKIWRNWP